MNDTHHTISGSLDPFDFGEPIGEGGMGKLWRARHRRQGVEVAVKFIQPGRLESERSRSMFRREAHAMALLNHRAILSIFDYGELLRPLKLAERTMQVGSPYLVMDYAGGGNLRERALPRDWYELSTTLEQILDGLAHAHSRSLYHRDMKPENIMVKRTPDGTQLQLTDFGLSYIANVASDTIERELSSAGTPGYMAPEQIEADWRRVGPWTDLYSVGVIAYELATGVLPFRSPSALAILTAHLKQPPPPLEPRISIPEAFSDWVLKLLAKQPEARFQTAVHALSELRAIDPGDLPRVEEPTEPDSELLQSETLVMPPRTHLPTLEAHTTYVFEPFSTDSRGTAPLPEFPVFPLTESWERGEASAPIVLAGVGLGLFGIRDLGLVQREAERDAIWANLQHVRESERPFLTLVRSPSGRGASSVASWTVRRSAELGAFEVVDMVHGTRYALEFLLGTRELEGPAREEAIAKSMEQIGRPELARPASAVIAGARGARPDRVLASYLEARARTRPIAVLIDDAHEELASLTLIRNLLDRKAPIAIVAVIREDDLATDPVANEIVYHLSRHELSESVALDPMSDEAMRAMLKRLIPLDTTDLESVVLRADGNPRFATELIRELVARGTLIPGAETYAVAPGEIIDIPDSMHASWATRVDQFIDNYTDEQQLDVRYSLELGAALGPRVRRADWDYAVELAGITIDKFFLNEAGEANLLEGDMVWGRFTHPMLPMSMLRTSREQGRLMHVHRLCERVISESYPLDDPNAQLQRIRHFRESGRPERGLELGLTALSGLADRPYLALRVADETRRAMRAVDVPDDDPRRATLARFIAEAVGRVSEPPESARHPIN